MVLYPLSAFRAMNKAALMFTRVKDKEHKRVLLVQSKTRMEPYDMLGTTTLMSKNG